MVGGTQHPMEDDLRWRTNFRGRKPSVEEDLWWKTTFGGRLPSVEDNLRGGRPLLIFAIIDYQMLTLVNFYSQFDIG